MLLGTLSYSRSRNSLSIVCIAFSIVARRTGSTSSSNKYSLKHIMTLSVSNEIRIGKESKATSLVSQEDA